MPSFDLGFDLDEIEEKSQDRLDEEHEKVNEKKNMRTKKPDDHRKNLSIQKLLLLHVRPNRV